MNKNTEIKDTQIGPVITDETGSYHLCRRKMTPEELSSGDLPNGEIVTENGVCFRVFRLDVTPAQKYNSDAVAAPLDMAAESLRLAEQQVAAYSEGGVAGILGREFAKNKYPDPTETQEDSHETIFGSLGLNTEDSRNDGASQTLSPDSVEFPKNVEVEIRESAEVSESYRGVAESRILDTIISADTRAWASPEDILWARELVSGILTSMTDVAERRIAEITKTLADGLVYGFLRRKFGTGIRLSKEELTGISVAVEAEHIVALSAE